MHDPGWKSARDRTPTRLAIPLGFTFTPAICGEPRTCDASSAMVPPFKPPVGREPRQ
jgi:hypothetical protein